MAPKVREFSWTAKMSMTPTFSAGSFKQGWTLDLEKALYIIQTVGGNILETITSKDDL